MPVYMRRRQASIAGTYNEFSSDEDDFIDDPDQWRDLLPQPFRLVTKLLDSTFDDVWEVIASREGERIAEAERVLPAPYSPASIIEDVTRVTCMCESPDGLFVFVGQNNGLSALRPGVSLPVDRWDSPDLDIASIACSRIGPDVYILSTNDDLGVSRIFGFAADRFYLMKAMNDQEGDKKVLASTVGIARLGDFCAVSLENPATGEQSLEAHKLPKELWFKEVDALASVRRQAVAKRAAAAEEADELGPRSATASPTQEDRANCKFSAPTLVFRGKPMGQLTGITAPNFAAALKPIDATGDLLGAGTTHLLTAAHIDARDAAFEILHGEQLKYLPKADEQEKEFHCPTWHFLTNGRFLPHGLELPQNENGGQVTAGLLVWWSGSRQLQLFSLLKTYKEVDHRPETIFPFESAICASCVSDCGSLAAIGLETGNVAILDLHLGLTRRVLNISAQPIWRLRFLAPSACASEVTSYPPYKDKVETKVLIIPEDKNYYLLDVSPGIYRSNAQRLEISAKHPDEMPAWVDYASVLPTIVLRVSQDGSLVLHDFVRSQELCRLEAPDDVRMAEPWQPALCFADNGKALYFRGQRTVTVAANTPMPPSTAGASSEPDPVPATPAAAAAAEESEGREEFVIVAVDLTRIPELQAAVARASFDLQPASVHPVLSERAAALLELRQRTHADRTEKLQNRWQHLKETFSLIQERRNKFSVDVLTLQTPDNESVLNSPSRASDLSW